MSARQRDILYAGTGHVAYARYDTSSALPRVDIFSTTEIAADTEDPHAYAGAMATALARLDPAPLRNVPLTVVCAPMPLLAKVVEVPRVAAAKAAETLRHEVRQAIPYPLEEVIWDHAVVGDDGLERRVALVAVRREWPEAIVDALRSAGLSVAEIAALPACMVNAARATEGGGDDRVLIDAGHRTTHLVFMGGEHFALRTAAFGHESAGADPETFVRRLGGEVARSLTAQKRQNKDYDPDHALVTGSALDSDSDLPALLGAYLGMSVEPLRAETGDGTHAVMLGAVADSGAPGMLRFDLLPGCLREARALRRRMPALALAACLFLAAAAVFYAGEWQKGRQLAAYLADLREAGTPVYTLDAKVRTISDEADALAAELRDIGALAEGRSNWLRFFADLQNRLLAVEDVWIDGLEVRRIPAPAAGPEEFHYEEEPLPPPRLSVELKLTGRMLDRENPLSRASPDMRTRVGALIDGFTLSEFVSTIGERRFDTSQPGILRFEFTLVTDPERPL
ncbi:MAG: hypothetical protein JJU00_04675 [Opitutales bacterium]|nr:hypothetical protein [Opitutales bacterium]